MSAESDVTVLRTYPIGSKQHSKTQNSGVQWVEDKMSKLNETPKI